MRFKWFASYSWFGVCEFDWGICYSANERNESCKAAAEDTDSYFFAWCEIDRYDEDKIPLHIVKWDEKYDHIPMCGFNGVFDGTFCVDDRAKWSKYAKKEKVMARRKSKPSKTARIGHPLDLDDQFVDDFGRWRVVMTQTLSTGEKGYLVENMDDGHDEWVTMDDINDAHAEEIEGARYWTSSPMFSDDNVWASKDSRRKQAVKWQDATVRDPYYSDWGQEQGWSIHKVRARIGGYTITVKNSDNGGIFVTAREPRSSLMHDYSMHNGNIECPSDWDQNAPQNAIVEDAVRRWIANGFDVTPLESEGWYSWRNASKTATSWQPFDANITTELGYMDKDEILSMYGAYVDESWTTTDNGMMGVVSHHVSSSDDWWTWDTYMGYLSYGIDCGTCGSLEEGKAMVEKSFWNPGFTLTGAKTADWDDNLFNIRGEDCDGVVEIHMDDSGNIEGYEVEVECYGDEGDDVINFYQQCFFPVTSLTDLAVEIASDCQAEYGGDLDIDTDALADEFGRHLNTPLGGLFASRSHIASGLVSEKIVPVGGTDWKIKFTLDYMGRDTLRIMNSEGWMTEILMDDSDWGYAYWLEHLADDVYEECLGGWFGYDAEDEMMWFRDDILDALFQIGDWELDEYRRLEEEAYGKESSKTAGGGPFPELSWFERSENAFGDERWEYQFEDYLIVFGQDMHGVVGDGKWDWEVSRANMRSDLMLQSWDKFDTLEEAYEDFRAVVFHEKDEPKSNLWFDDMRGTDLAFSSKSASRTFTYAEQEELQDESIGTLCRNHSKLKGHEDGGETAESMFV